jgi:hypothetical protein
MLAESTMQRIEKQTTPVHCSGLGEFTFRRHSRRSVPARTEIVGQAPFAILDKIIVPNQG